MSDKDIIENYKKELAKVGLELPQDSENVSDTADSESQNASEEKREPEEKEDKEQPEKDKPQEEPQEKPQEEPPAPSPAPSQRKRTIYEDLKEKRKELRTERELREQIERERDELRARLEAISNAKTDEELSDADDELSRFAKEIGADPEAIRKMRELFLKGIEIPQVDTSIKRDLDEFRQWKAQNSVAIEQQMFEQEFQRTIPVLKELFPNANQEELDAIKKELDVISHTKEWHDKELDYIAFRHKEKLSSLVSPKKRGLEKSGRASDSAEEKDFDPNADLSSMSPTARQKWYEEYQRISEKQKGVFTDSSGKKMLI